MDQSSRMWHLIIVLTWRTFNLHENLCSSCPGSAVDSDLWMAWQKPADPFCIDITAIWGLLHRWRVMGPSSGASVALIWAVTFVPEWNFDSFLSLCCFLFFLLFPFWSMSSLHLRGCLFWHLAHRCQTKSDFFLTNHHMIFGTVGVGGRLSAVNKRVGGGMHAPSGRFSSIHQLPGCTPKIEKPLFSSLLSPRQALLMCYRWIRLCAKHFCAYRPIHSSL